MINNEFISVLHFPDYYSAGKIQFGIDGPEIFENKLYISIYHYLQYIGEDPKDYNTFELGKDLTSKSTAYKKCKYECQSFEINKFELDLLKIERVNFNLFQKEKKSGHKSKVNNTSSSMSLNDNDYVSRGGYKTCVNCGEWHDANFALCARCNGKSSRGNWHGEDYF